MKSELSFFLILYVSRLSFFSLWLTSTVYGEVRRASREAIIAPHSLYTLMCVVSCGVLVDSTKYSTKLDEVQLTVDDVVKLVERKRLENAILRAAGNFTTSVRITAVTG